MKPSINRILFLALLGIGAHVKAQDIVSPETDPLDWVDLSDLGSSDPMTILMERRELFGIGTADSMHFVSSKRDGLDINTTASTSITSG